MRIYASIRYGHMDPGPTRDVVSLVHLEEGQMPLILSDSRSILWRDWLPCRNRDEADGGQD